MTIHTGSPLFLYFRHPSSWRLGFLAKKLLGILTFLAKILAIILGEVRKILQDFSKLWKRIKENFWNF